MKQQNKFKKKKKKCKNQQTFKHYQEQLLADEHKI